MTTNNFYFIFQAHEILALELLTLFVETPTEDSIEVAVAFLKECGQKMRQVSKKGMNAIFDMLRNILHDGQLDKRVIKINKYCQYFHIILHNINNC